MALIVEDGSEVPNANAYVSLANLRAFALARGVVLSGVDSIVEIASFKATDHFESFANRFKGSKVTATQSLQFPRAGFTVDGFLIDSNVIHQLVVKCIGQLVIEIHNGIDIAPTNDGKFLVREKIDVIENEWKPGSGSGQPNMPIFDSLISQLLKTGTGGLTVTRA